MDLAASWKRMPSLRTNLLRVKAAAAEAAETAAAGALILLLAGEEDASGRKQPGIDPA